MLGLRQQATVMGLAMPISQADVEEKGHAENANARPAHGNAKPAKNKTRLRWTPELHKKFVDVVDMLGGPESTSLTCVLYANTHTRICITSTYILRTEKDPTIC